MRRPAAAEGRVMRRPARVEGEAQAPGAPRNVLGDLSVAELSRLTHVWFKKALYYHQEVDVAGKLEGVRVNDGNLFVDIEATGTKDEKLLRALTSKKGKRLSLHVCPPECGAQLTDEFLAHAREYEPIDLAKQPWFTNLVSVGGGEGGEADELAEMRQDAEKHRGAAEGRREESPRNKKEKRKKDKKEKGAKVEKKDKKAAGSSASEVVEVGQKPLAALFSGTGLDPSAGARRRILKKARKLGRSKKKRKKSSSGSTTSNSGSTSESSSSKDVAGGLFSSERRMRTIWRKYPGALAATAVVEARQSLLTASGHLWEVDKRSLPPLATQFTRQHLAGGMSPPMLQEACTIAACLDGLLLGKVAWTADVLSQRLKSLEALSCGTHWSVARQLELIRSDPMSITGEAEGLDAAKAARDEEKLRQSMSKGGGPRGAPKGKKGGKEAKGMGKVGNDDSNRGKGSGARKEQKGEWQKKDK
jgi:hypothetical protein